MSDKCPGCGAKGDVTDGCGCVHYECESTSPCPVRQDECYEGPFLKSIKCVERQLAQRDEQIVKLTTRHAKAHERRRKAERELAEVKAENVRLRKRPKTEWRQFSGDCIFCGDEAEVLTNAGQDNFAYDGDEARCVSCRCPGSVIVPGDDDSAYIVWHDEPDCDCEWCKMSRALEEQQTAEAAKKETNEIPDDFIPTLKGTNTKRYVAREVGKMTDTCETCGATIIDDCPQCGAPQCCPNCCSDSTKEAIAMADTPDNAVPAAWMVTFELQAERKENTALRAVLRDIQVMAEGGHDGGVLMPIAAKAREALGGSTDKEK